MARKQTPLPSDLVQMHPGLGILRLAALLADGDDVDEDTLDLMFEQMESGALGATPPRLMWPELARGLMARSPHTMIRALRESGALSIVLPEVAALWGVPQITDEGPEADIGDHLLSALFEAARRDAPLAVRFALLTMNVGKSDSPRERLPVHDRHVERGAPRIEAIARRFGAPEVCRELALLALSECERVHRVSEMRAGPVAALLERCGAFDDPTLFQMLLAVCTCDYAACDGRSGLHHPKAELIARALHACAAVDDSDVAESAAEVQAARAVAIAQALRSPRWSDGVKDSDG